MGMVKCDVSDAMIKRRTHMRFEDFDNFTSGGLWTTTTAGSGAASVGNTQWGQINLLPTDNTTNREVYVATTNALFLIKNNINLVAECYLQFSEAATNKANIAFGFMSSVGAASMADTTGEPKASFSGAVIYKVPGATVWKCASSVGTGLVGPTISTKTAGGTSFQALRIEIHPVSTTIAEVTYYVNDIQLLQTTGRPGQNLIKDQLTYTSAAAMQLFVMCKNGQASAESLFVDYIAWSQLRAPLYVSPP